MRVAALLLVAACAPAYSSGDDYYGGYTPDPGRAPSGNLCESDAACGTGNVCARDGACVAAEDVVVAHVAWTLSGAPANAQTCANLLDLDIQFVDQADDYWFGFSPVPCVEGKFTIDKLPKWYTQVGLGPIGDRTGASGFLDGTTGVVSIDLPY